ncbi:MAG: hypothetical protein ACPGNT_08680, partial [Rhodospirillales bacterium]
HPDCAEVVYRCAFKHHLGPRAVELVSIRPGETAQNAAKRALASRYKVRDYVILEIRPFACGMDDQDWLQAA